LLPFSRSSFLDPAALGSHKFGSRPNLNPFSLSLAEDTVGLVYTCHAGFIDFGHLRDTADLTLYYFTRLSEKNKRGDTFTFGPFYSGTVTINADVPPLSSPRSEPDMLSVAKCLAYDEALFHEVESFWRLEDGMHHSAFSPEDLVSNYLGTLVAGIALERSRSLNEVLFEPEVTSAIDEVLMLLGVLPPTGTADAFAKIAGTWVSGHYRSQRYLLRRNFDWEVISPWLVSGVTGCSGESPTPFTLLDARSFYAASYDVPAEAQHAMGAPPVVTSGLGAEVAKCRTRATSPVSATDPYAYGTGADAP
jgi:hypothetical protein